MKIVGLCISIVATFPTVVVVAFSLSVLFFFSFMEISSSTPIPLYRPGSVHSGLASWDNCGWMFPVELYVSSFPDRFPHCARTTAKSAYSNFDDGSRVYACLGVTGHLHFWQNDWVFLRANMATGGWDRHRWRVSKQTLEKKILPLLLLGFELTTFR